MAQPINQRTWRCWPVEDDPHRDLSGLDLWMVAVLQYLNPRDRPIRGKPW
jgi:hypothetical protein